MSYEENGELLFKEAIVPDSVVDDLSEQPTPLSMLSPRDLTQKKLIVS